MNRLILPGLALVLMMPAMATAQNPAEVREKIDGTRATIENMVNVRTHLSKERRDWTLYREMAERRIDLFRSERDNLQTQLEETESRTTEAERRIAEIRDEIEGARAANRSVRDALPNLEARLQEMIQFFPKPLQSQVQRLAGQIGKSQQASDRMAIIIGILNEADRFNSLFHLSVEDRTLDGGEIVSVDILYIGLAFAYFVDREGRVAGYGVPAEGEWTWVEQPALAGDIRRAVDYYQGRIKPAQAVQLPLRVTQISFE